MFPFTVARAQPQPRKAAQSAGLLDRAPSLRSGAERIVLAMLKALQTMAGPTTTVEGSLVEITESSVRDYVAAHRPESVAATIQCAGLPCTIVARLSPALVHGIVELLAGGNGSEPLPAAPRPATSIDVQYAQIVVTLAAAAIESEWAPFGFGSARAMRLEGTLAPDVCGADVQSVGVLNLRLDIFGLRGKMSLALPPAALDAFAAGGSAPGPSDFTFDPSWETSLHRELGHAPVTLSAFLEAEALPLGAIAGLVPGQILAISPAARGRASLACDERTLYRGELGQDDDRFSLRIDELVVNDPRPQPTGSLGRSRQSRDLAKAS